MIRDYFRLSSTGDINSCYWHHN